MSARHEIENRAYYSQRAMEELIKAATCEDNTVARAHLNLADEYQKRAATLSDKFDLIETRDLPLCQNR
jgi:hypothetical protein